MARSTQTTSCRFNIIALYGCLAQCSIIVHNRYLAAGIVLWDHAVHLHVTSIKRSLKAIFSKMGGLAAKVSTYSLAQVGCALCNGDTQLIARTLFSITTTTLAMFSTNILEKHGVKI